MMQNGSNWKINRFNCFNYSYNNSSSSLEASQVFQFIQEYTGVVSPGILAVFLMGLFFIKRLQIMHLFGVILSIPIAMYFKVAPNGWNESFIFVNLPFMHQMMFTCLGTLLVIYIISNIESKEDDQRN